MPQILAEFTRKWTPRETIEAPLKWRKPATVRLLSDLFHKDVPFEFIDKVFAVMNATAFRFPLDPSNVRRWHTYQILTKRPERMAEYILSRSTRNFLQGEHPIFDAGRGKNGVLRGHGRDLMNAGAVLMWPLPNVWLGTSVEDQQRADERIPHLLRCPAAVLFLSAEPLLGAITLDSGPRGGHPRYLSREVDHASDASIDWVIVGGESGAHARPMEVRWAQQIVDQCRAADVPVFVKQLGARPYMSDAPIRVHLKLGEFGGLNLSDKKGGDWSEWPEDLRVRQFPEPVHA